MRIDEAIGYICGLSMIAIIGGMAAYMLWDTFKEAAAHRRYREAFDRDDIATLKGILCPYGHPIIGTDVISSNYDLIKSLDLTMTKVMMKISIDDQKYIIRALRQPSIVGRANYIIETYKEIVNV